MTMTPFIHPLFRLCASIPLPAEALEVLAVLLGSVLCLLIIFSAQLFLIYRIEQGRFFRHRQRRPQPNEPSPSRPSPQLRSRIDDIG
jgi:hypothetical protein